MPSQASLILSDLLASLVHDNEAKIEQGFYFVFFIPEYISVQMYD